MSYEEQIKDGATRLALLTAADVVRVQALQGAESEFGQGYNEGIEQAIKSIQLLLQEIDKTEPPSNEWMEESTSSSKEIR